MLHGVVGTSWICIPLRTKMFSFSWGFSHNNTQNIGPLGSVCWSLQQEFLDPPRQCIDGYVLVDYTVMAVHYLTPASEGYIREGNIFNYVCPVHSTPPPHSQHTGQNILQCIQISPLPHPPTHRLPTRQTRGRLRAGGDTSDRKAFLSVYSGWIGIKLSLARDAACLFNSRCHSVHPPPGTSYNESSTH